MNTVARCRNVAVSSLVALLGASQPTSAVAQALIWAGDVSAVFGEPTSFDGDPSSAVYFGVGTDTLTSGDGSPVGSLPTRFSVLGQNFNTPIDTEFSLAEFTVFNGTTALGTNVTSVPIEFSFDFSSPVSQSDIKFEVTLLQEATPNDPGDVPDIVGISQPSVQTIEVDGIVYELEILGFTNGDNELVVGEQETVTDNLFAIIRITPTREKTEQSMRAISTSLNTASTAAAIADSCPQLFARESDPQFLKDCSNLVGGAISPEGSLANAQATIALSIITPEQATAPLSSSRGSLSTQLQNLSTRLSALRGGARGIQLQGLTLGAAEQDGGGDDLAGLSSALGGGASADEGSMFVLGDGRLGVFVNGTISTGDKEETKNEDGFNFDAWGITAGLDYRFRDNLIAGIAGGYNKGETDIDNSGGRLDTDGYSISLYGTYFQGESAYIDAILTYGRNDYDQERNIRYRVADYNVNQTASADYDGSQWSGAIGVGYDIPKGPWTFGPVARAQYLSADVDGYSESMSNPNTNGGGWATRLDDMDQESFTTTLGGNVSRAISTKWGVLIPQLHLSWVHEFMDDAISINGTFIEDPSNSVFGIRSDRPDSDYFNARLAMSAQFAGGSSAFLYYNKVLGYRDLNVDTFGAGVRMEF